MKESYESFDAQFNEARKVEQEAIRAFRNPAGVSTEEYVNFLYPKPVKRETDWLDVAFGVLAALIFAGAFFFLFFLANADAQEIKPAINMEAIAQIESSGNPRAWNKRDDSRGLFQITPICLKEWNNFHPKDQLTMDDLWDASVNRKVAEWYINVRIPAMLRHYNKPESVANQIVAYNAGISYVVKNKPLPKITRDYLAKYERLTHVTK